MRAVILLLFVGFFVRPAAAAELNERLDEACFTELSFFCPRTPRKLEPRLKCLHEHSDSLTNRCVSGLKVIADAVAKPPEVVVSTVPATVATAPKMSAAVSMPAEMETHLTRFDGSVYVHVATQPKDQFLKAEKNLPLDKGDIVRTGADGAAEIGVNAESVIELGPNTDFQIDELAPKKTDWRLSLGSIVAKIHPLLEGQEMRFNSSSAVAAIRGTELTISQDNDTTTIGVLDEGRVTVTSAKGSPPVFLKPHQETRVAQGKTPSPAVPFAAKPELRKQIDEARERAAQIKKEWKAMGAKGRSDFRQLLAKRPALPGDKLPNAPRKAIAGAAAAGGKPQPPSTKQPPAQKGGPAEPAQQQQQGQRPQQPSPSQSKQPPPKRK